MDIEELRQKIATGEIKPKGSNTVIETGKLLNHEDKSFEYEITHGWDMFSSYRCDQEWQAFHMGFFELIRNQNYSKKSLYIEFLAVAPWNRETPVTNREFKGVGTILIKCALNYAVNELGLQYGFALHSLPQSKNYYEKIGMIKFPERDKDNLVYFEMPRDESTEMLGVS